MPGVVASGHAEVSRAACEVLAAGGNAFDAAVAAGMASAVAEPALTSLGGGGFLLARTVEGRAVLFDFFVDTPGRGLASAADLEPHFVPVTVHFPGADQVFNAGLGSVAVPGNVRGFLHVQRRLGRLPLSSVIAPAARLAREGLALNAMQAYFLDLLEPIMRLRADGEALFARGGHYLREGDRFRNPDLADFLESLARDGERELYEGELARRIADDMRAGQGLLTERDLRHHRVVEREPTSVTYRGFRLLTNPPPSFGGALLALSLRLLERVDPAPLRFGSPEHLVALVSVMEEVDRRRAVGDFAPERDSPRAFDESVARIRTSTGGTTHISVCDAEGNVASMTTSNGEGSGYLVPGTGVMLNNMMGEDDLHPEGFHASPPGQRVASMMSPSILLRNDRPCLALGSGGSKRIRTVLLQVVSDVVDFGMSAVEAVDAPRLHWDGECVQAEPGLAPAALAALEARWPVNVWQVRDVYFGGAHVASPEGQGAGDPRRGGHCALGS